MIGYDVEEPESEAGSSEAALSYGQRALWFLHHLAPVGGAYNIAAAARAHAALDPDALEGAFQALVDRHAALRTTFPAAGGAPRQRIAPQATFVLARQDAGGWSEAALRARLADEAWRPFDLERGPLLRVTLFTGAPAGPVILLVIHHIVADFWSLAILFRELPALYREAAGGAPAELPPPGLPYEEHVQREREALAGARGAALLAHWRRALAGLPTLELALDRPRPAVQTYHGDCRRLRLPGELAAALRARSREHHGTLFMTLAAAFQTLLARHTGQEDLAIGSPRAGRAQADFAGTLGYFVNPVVLRGDLAGDPAFTVLLDRTKAAVATAFEHGEMPLPLLAEHLQPVRDASRTPLFQVSFVMQKETRGAQGLTAFALGEEGVDIGPADFRLVSLSLPRPPAPFDLQLHAVERQGGLSCGLQFNSDLFDPATAERLLQRFAVLLAAVAAHPEQPLSTLPLLPAAERHQLLHAWNDTAGRASESDLFTWFAARAARAPDEVALVYEDRQVSCGELARRARGFAAQLACSGVGPEVVVGVAAERSIEMVVALLGVLGAGGAYLPLEPSLPRQRLAAILDDARPGVLLAARAGAHALPLDAASGPPVVWLDAIAEPHWQEPAGTPPPAARVAAGNAAYVIYTSGSTGRPKGVVNSHRGILNRLLWMRDALDLRPDERWLQKTPFGFDVSVQEFFASLIFGGRLVMARPEGHRDSAYLVRLVQQEAITAIHFVPSMLPFFLAEEGAADCRSLRRVLASGEALPWEAEQRCLAVLTAPLYNLYGPTEAAVDVTAWPAQPAARARPVPIGRPVRNTTVRVVGRQLDLLPAGAAGELVIGGIQVARGYLGRPELTAAAFVPDPWATAAGGAAAGARMYRTGDLCRHLPGGEVAYLGRLDTQVKIRGFRIEPREIELALAAHPRVREAAVLPRHQDAGAETALLACVVLREAIPGEDAAGAAAAAAELRAHLAALLPPYMVPLFAFGAALERLPNGKLDRRRLARWPPVAAQAAPAGAVAGAPRTPLEEILAGAFAEVLGVEQVGVDDDFFAQGGHSLAAMRLLARIRETLHVELPLHRVFEATTVAALAAAIRDAGAAAPDGRVPALTPRGAAPDSGGAAGETLPLSFAQQRLWFLYQFEPASAVYNMPAAVHLAGGALDPALLAAALDEVTRRHEVLRTRLAATPAGPVQMVDPPTRGALPVIDLAALPAARRAAEARRLARAAARRPFDLERGPLLRASLARLAGGEALLLLTLHHVAGDGWSLRLLAAELSQLYAAFLAGRPSPLPPLPVQYADYAVWQRRWLAGDRLAAELAHWREHLAGAPAVQELPLDRPRPAVATDRGASRALALAPPLLAALRTLARRQGVTLFMAALAAFQALLARLGGRDDVSVGTPVAGRSQVATERLIGFFVNTLVMRTDLAGEPSFSAQVARVREVALAAYVHQDLPFEKLVEELQPRRDLSYAPLFQVAFALDDEPPPALELPGVAATPWPLPAETEKSDLSLTLESAGDVLRGTFGFRTDLFDGATIERLAGQFARLLNAAVAAPATSIADLPLLGDAERHEILIEWGGPQAAAGVAAATAPAAGTASPARGAATLPALFAARVESDPAAPAVIFGDSRLTCGELGRRVERLARRLRRHGVGPETIVGVCLPPAVDLLVTVLAVWRAGGAFLPLDPAYAVDRLAFMIADSGARWIVARRGLASLAALAATGAGQILLDADADTDADADENDEESAAGGASARPAQPQDLAYVIYTSGSTGRPKGVAVQQGEAAGHMRNVAALWGLGSGDRVLQFASPSFDVWLEETLPALFAGAALVLRGGELWEPAHLLARCRDLGLTVVDLPTAFWQQWVAALEAVATLPAGLALRLVVVGGEAMAAADARRWLGSPLGGVRLLNAYGPTEAVVTATFCAVEELAAADAAVPLGQPLAGRSVRLLDRRGRPVPTGVAGEICLGGAGLARGYLGRPDLTAERFAPDPFAPREGGVDGGRLYRTGDLARYRPGGRLDFLGRIDHQVKVRGFRIELGEIEAALLAHPRVAAAAVLARQDPAGGTSLAAWLAAAAGAAPPAPAELRDFLRRRLPDFMLPATIAVLPALPLAASGKVDRRALAALPLPAAGESVDGAAMAPRTPTEELVAGIFADVLQRGPVAADESFFDLGGHSLLATQVAARARAVFGIELPVRAVFEAPTVAGLAGAIERLAGGQGEAADATPIERLPAGNLAALSFAQQRLWFLDQLEPESPAYNIAARVTLDGRLDAAALAAALGAVIARHAALRTTFPSVGGEPVQVVAAAAAAGRTAAALPRVDLTALPVGRHDDAAAALAAAAARRPFDLARGPLLRLTLLRSAAERHAALVTLHHIVGDGWSMGLLVSELAALYAAAAAGRPSPLPELPIQYADFAAWQRRRLAGERLAAELAWWRERLAGMPPALELPADQARPALHSGRGGVQLFAIDARSTAALAALARRHGATLFMTLFAGFAELLRRYGGADDLAVGTPIAGRTRVETEPLIGLFVNTLVLRADLAGDPDVAALLARVRDTALAAYAHQEVPFERLVEELAPERDLRTQPLVQVLFALQNAPAGRFELPGLVLAAAPVDTGTAKFDLTCTLEETAPGEGLAGTLEYSRDLFEPATVERLAGHLVRLLAGIAADPARHLSELPLLGAAERAELLTEWSGTATAYPRDSPIHQLFAEQAAARPDAVAVAIAGGAAGAAECLTYGELAGRAELLARRLRAAGVGPEVRVGVCLDRSPERIVATLAVLMAGGAYVPLDPAYPRERLAFLVRDSAAPLLLTTERWLAVLPPADAAVVCMDSDAPAADGAAGAVLPQVDASGLAYVMYTSGSTGEPKGAAVPHRAVVRLVRGAGFARFAPDEVFLQLAPYAFDASTLEIWGPLLHGGRLVMPPPGVLAPPELGDLLNRHAVTTLWLTAGLFHQMVEENLAGLAGVRQLLAGGDVLSVPHVRRVLAELPGTRLINGYGPTENTTFTCCHPVTALSGPPGREDSVPLGRPIANTRVYVLDRDLAPVPAGVPGELLAGGDGLARGYLGRPERTAERFVPDPTGGEPGARLYRTGDRVRWRTPGGGSGAHDLEYLGRIDTQVKVRGFRVEPGEIEAALLAHPRVRGAAVLAQAEGAGGRRLVAYVAADPQAPPPTAELHAMLRRRLPDFMVPSAYAVLPALPLSANGKVDRRALARVPVARPGSDGADGADDADSADGTDPAAARAPRSPAEDLVAGIFAEVLQLPRVGPADDFFALGGHSLLATQVVSRLRAAFRIELPVRAIFETPTVEELAAAVERSAGLRTAAPPIPRRSPEEQASAPPVLSFAQRRLWLLDQLEPGSPVYNVPAAIAMSGHLDAAALAAALGEIVRRHETLRTRFQPAAAEPVPVVAAVAGLAVPVIDLAGLPAGARDAAASRLATGEARRPFDLGESGGPLLRAALLRTAPEQHRLLLTLHHIASDGWSMGVLVRELGALYGAFAARRPSPLPELPIQYADFAAWQRRRLAGETLATELAWWRDRLAGLPPALALPLDHARPAALSTRGATHPFALDGAALADLERLARGHGATLFMTLLAGFAGLLSRYTGEDDLAVGTPIAGRTRVETEPLIGLFVNTLVLRTDLAGDPPLADLLARVRETTLAAYAHQEVPFERLVEELAPDRDLSRPPLVQTLFIVQNAPVAPLALPGLALAVTSPDTGTAKFELTCSLVQTAAGLAGEIEYSRDLFERPTIARLAGHFTRLLAAAAADPGARLSQLPLLAAAERRQLLAEWNDVGTVPPDAACLHELFAAQAARRPQAIALVAGVSGERWTYGELDRWAGALAQRLAALGVAPEARVAVCLTRTPLLVAALLAVLEAGGAYVPLDPEYPDERLAFMLADSAAAVLVTEPRLAGRFAGHPGAVLVVDPATDTGREVSAAGEPRDWRQARPSNVAYLIYTSGSTGRPKGVAIEHRSAVAFAHWARTVFTPADLAGVLAATSICFDLSVFELFVTLAWGGKVVLAADALELPRLAAAREVTLLNTVPSAMAELVRQRAVPESVRTVNLAGEPLKQALVAGIRAVAPAARVLNLYGPSEATTYSTFATAAPAGGGTGDGGATSEPVIGRPIAGTRAVLVGRRGEPVPLGVAGELLLGGAGLARGYHDRPELTAERWVPDPFAAEAGGGAGARLYRTGDLARWLPDGRLDYLGRIDHQVKVRGFRIEIGEIEAALSRHAAVAAAAVVLLAASGGPEGRRLAAFVAARDGSVASDNGGVVLGAVGAAPPALAAELRRHLEATLPGYMVPSFLTVLPALPLTPSGKIDRKALLAWPPADLADGGGEPAAPLTPVEELVSGIFAGVLGVERVAPGASFFALGGHSLLATQVVSRVRQVFGLELPLRAVFEAPAAASLAAMIARLLAEGAAGAGEARAAAPAGTAAGRPSRAARSAAEEPPLSFSQERLWFLQALDPGSAAYNIPVTVAMAGELDRGALAAALAEIARRHEALRTTFPAVAGDPRQRIAPPAPSWPLPLVDLAALPPAAGGAEAERLEAAHAGEHLDLAHGPLVRALLLRLGAASHRFTLNLHHIVADGWSLGVLVRELAALYGASRLGRPSPLAELPIQYADFAVWQRRRLAETLEADLAHWQASLAGAAAAEIPADHPRTAAPAFRGGRCQAVVPAELTARLERFGHQEGVTLFMTLLAAWQTLVARHSGEEDVSIGAPVAGRRWAETEGLIGCFLNTLVLRTDLAGQPSFRQLAARVRQVTLDAYAHQDAPFEAVLSRLRVDRDLARAPLFQVLFNMLNLPAGEVALPGLALRVLTPAEAPSKLDLTVYVAKTGGALAVELVYNADLFAAARIRELAAQLEILLAQAMEHPDEPLDRLPLLTAASLSLLPDPAAALAQPAFPPVARLFLERAQAAAGEPALAWSGGAWTYGELAARACDMARILADAGVEPGAAIAVAGPRSPELIAGLLGVFLAGGVLLLLDRKLPAARLRIMVEDARAVCLVLAPGGAGDDANGGGGGGGENEAEPDTEAGWLAALGPLPVVTVPSSGPAGSADATPLPGLAAAPDAPAYVFFTSGTTGRPKAVLGRHKGLSHFLTWQREEFGVGPGDRAAQLTGLSFDVVLRDILLPLTSGATLVLPDPDDFDPARLLGWLAARAITVVHTVPTLAGAWLSAAPPGLAALSLRHTFFAGEPLLDPVVRRWRAAFPHTAVINLYGPTETTLAKCFFRVPEPPLPQVQPVGRPLPQTQALIVAGGRRRCGLGEVGEIVVRTPFRSLGYLNDAADNGRRFRPNPWRGDADDLLYFTGDRGRYRLDGTVEILGRVDEQVKLRGVRIEPGEIKAALGRHPAVWDSVVVLRRPAADRPGDERLVAYVVLRPGAALDPEALRRHLRAALSEAMVPASFVALEALPVTANGKVDRRALERIAPDLDAAAGGEWTPPRTPTEELVAGIWAQVLGRERVGPWDNFFELGGHSLLATQVVARLKNVFGVELPLRRLFAAPTVAALAAELEQRSDEAAGPPLAPTARHGDLPLSFAQQRLWFLTQLQPDNPVYNMPVALRLAGTLAVPALAASLAEVVRRHESLRTVFVLVEGQPFQRILPPAPVPLGIVDLAGLEPAPGEAEGARLLRQHAERPFDLGRGPLLRGVLLRLGAAEHVVLLNQHHIVSDGWSIGVLVAEVVALYGAFAAGRPSPLPELAIQYADFAVWQRAWLTGAVLERQVSYWRERLADLPALLELPTDRPRPAFRTGHGSRGAFHLPLAAWRAATALGRRQGATDFMVLLALFHVLLARLSGQAQLAAGTIIANRGRAELEPLIGFFANALVMRGDLSGRPSLGEMLRRTRESALEAYAHQDLPFEHLVETLQPARATSYTPLFQVVIALQNAPHAALAWPGLTATQIEAGNETGAARFDLALNLMETPRGLGGSVEYATDLFDAATIARLAGQFAALLAAAVDPDALAAELPLLSPGERHQIVAEWNDTEAAFPAATLLHQFFEAAADRAPAACAALCAGREMTYGELEARANRLAHLLRQGGVGRGTPVGVWVERGFDMLAAVLGVQKAGGHYVALDAAWPAERVESILASTRAPAIVAGRRLLPAVEEMCWRLPALGGIACLAIAAPEPPSEALDPADVRALWDYVAERAVDRVTAGGFVSAVTGASFGDAEVDEYRDRVLGLAAPWLRAGARVLEIGNGSGLLLWEMAARAGHVTGIDPSPLTQERNRAHAARQGIGNVELFTGFAHDLDALTGGGGGERFDLVLLASTVQFFPGPNYLKQVLRAALARLAPGGAVLVADVLDPRHRDDLRQAIAAHRAPAAAGDGAAAGAKGAGATGGAAAAAPAARRQELYLDEDLFRDFGDLREMGAAAAAADAADGGEAGEPAGGAVEVAIHRRREGFANELRWRYDVLLTPAAPAGGGFRAAPAAHAGGRPRKRIWTGWHLERQPASRLAAVAAPEDLAYVIYTSGSTGVPKGIFVQHRPAANLVTWINDTFEIGPADRGLFVTSLCFDLSVYDIFGLLGAGGTVHIASEEELADPDHLVEQLRRGGITLWDSAPAALVQLAPLFPAAPAAPAAFSAPSAPGAPGAPSAPGADSRLRRVLLSGDWIPVTLPDRVREAFPRAEVMALGGATEATVWSNWFPVREVDPRWASIPYGRPIANARYHVLDAAFAPCPIGVAGDLYIGGDCLCGGYAGRPDLTAAAFVPDAFGWRPGARMYRTGDRARYGVAGVMEFLGRLDQQVKVRGYRIELGEIEVALARHPAVREAVVLVRQDQPGDQRLVAYVVPAAAAAAAAAPAIPATLATSELRDALRRTLPEYMIPTAFVLLAELPVTANGKLDRQALPAPQWARGGAAGGRSAAARSPIEEIVAGLWSEVLGISSIGADDNFFELGGHSLSGAQVISRLRQAVDVDLPLRVLFEAPTVAGLAAEVERLRQPGGAAERPSIASFRHDRGAPAPLSFAQERLWAGRHAEAASGSPHAILTLVGFTGELDLACLRRALQEILDRHEVLRTRFAETPAGPVQVIQAGVAAHLPLIDLEPLPAERRLPEIRRLADLAARIPYDYAQAPMLRLALYRRGAHDHVLWLSTHHVAFDGWSAAIVSGELAELYNAFHAGRPSPLVPLAAQYQDFARWQRRTLAGDHLDREVRFWRQHLTGARSLDLRGERLPGLPGPPVAHKAAKAGVAGVAVPPDLEGRLEALATRHGATVFMTLLAAFNALLHLETGEDDIVIICLFANRNHAEVEGMIGNFYAGVPLRTRLTGATTFRALLDQVRAVTLAAHEHPDILYEPVFEGMGFTADDDEGGLQTFRILFQVVNLPSAEASWAGGLQSSRLPYMSDTMRKDLSLFFTQGGGLAGRFRYNRDVLDEARVSRMRDRFLRILAAVAADPDSPLGAL